jgi:hypothetical protein
MGAEMGTEMGTGMYLTTRKRTRLNNECNLFTFAAYARHVALMEMLEEVRLARDRRVMCILGGKDQSRISVIEIITHSFICPLNFGQSRTGTYYWWLQVGVTDVWAAR